MKTIAEQVLEAERVYQEAVKRAPRAGRTARLWWQFRQLKMKQLAAEVRQEKRARVA